MEGVVLKVFIPAAIALVLVSQGARAEDCDKKESEIERRQCMGKEIAEYYTKVEKLAEANAKKAEAISEGNTLRYRKALRDAQKHWKLYVETYCGALAIGGGGSAGVDSMLFCKIDRISAREKELGGK